MASIPKRLTTAAAIAAAIAVPAEGLRQLAYYDPPGILTVCYGHTGPDVIKGKVFSLTECTALLDEDMMRAVVAVDNCQPNLPGPVLAAFADAVYNLGPKVACNTSASTAARLLKAGDYTAACKQLPRWDKANVAGALIPLPGLTKRRKTEEALCLTYSS